MSSLARISVPADLAARGPIRDRTSLWLGFRAWLERALSRADSTPLQGL